MLEHAVDFIAGCIQIVYEFDSADCHDAIEVPVGKGHGAYIRGIEPHLGAELLESFGDGLGARVDVHSPQFVGVLGKLGHEDAATIANFQETLKFASPNHFEDQAEAAARDKAK